MGRAFMKKYAFAAFFTLAVAGNVVADEFPATFIKVEGNKVTFLKGKEGEQLEFTAEVVRIAEVRKGRTDSTEPRLLLPDEPIERGLKNEMFSKVGKGLKSQITTDDKGMITRILVRVTKKAVGKH
jgi:hypothetical protein